MRAKNDASHVIRLLPGEDLLVSIRQFLIKENIQAGWIASCAGSLSEYTMRFANERHAAKRNGYFEIVNLTGTLSANGSHLYICLSNNVGETTGGHLLEGGKIYTTAEIVLIESGKYIFTREHDGSTPWNELQVKKR